MGNMDRRHFMGSAAALAAGAAVGKHAFDGIKEHGPVEIRAYLFSPEPIVIPGRLFADERLDIFGVRVFEEDQEHARAEFSLSDVKKVLASSSKTAKIPMTVKGNHVENGTVTLVVEKGTFTFYMYEDSATPAPVWLQLEDVLRVV